MNPKVHHRAYRGPPRLAVRNQMNPDHTTPYDFSKINRIVSSELHLGFPSSRCPSGFPIKTLYLYNFPGLPPRVLHDLLAVYSYTIYDSYY
jgi:hypothetical protein